jgi:Transposase DDE domain
VEPLFGEAKDWHGMRRFRLTRLEKVNIEALLIASGQNTKRLLTFGQKGPRRPAQVVALRVTPTARRAHRGLPSGRQFLLARAFFKRLSSFVEMSEKKREREITMENAVSGRRLARK